MRLSRAAILSKRRKNPRVVRVKQKHKKLDAICEKAYNQNHIGLESPRLSECNGDTSEVRRSSRVRRAPLVLDASPSPPKKRRRISEGTGAGSSKNVRDRDHVGFKIESPCTTSRDLKEEESGEWRSRLRTRDRKVTFVTEQSTSSPRGKRKLFGDTDGHKDQLNHEDINLDDKKGGAVVETSMIVKSKRSGRTRSSFAKRGQHENIDLGNNEKEKDDKLQVVEDKINGYLHEEGVKDNSAVIELLEQGNEIPVSFNSEGTANGIMQSVEQNKKLGDQLEFWERENQSVQEEVSGAHSDHVEDSTTLINRLKDMDSTKAGDVKYSLSHRHHKSRIKKGRWCGLCGGGIDGKPPKKLVQNGADSDDEAYSGSSSSEEPNYDILDGFGDEPGWLGRLLGPINDRFGIAGIWVHQHCAIWSPEDIV